MSEYVKHLLILIFGIIFGFCGIIMFEYIFERPIVNPTKYDFNIKLLKEETNSRLLKYIEGEWISPKGDFILQIKDSSINGLIITFEFNQKNFKSRNYKVVKIDDIDGILGVVKLSICELNLCNSEIYNIQINKLFGVDNTISVTFDEHMIYCNTPIDKKCTRSFYTNNS